MLDVKKTLAKILGQTEFRTLLWTGTYTTFAAQTIALNLNPYEFIEVWFYPGGEADPLLPNPLKVPIGELRHIALIHGLGVNGTNENTGSRQVSANANGAVFGNYAYKNRRSGGTLTTANQYCIPKKIYGVKIVK